MLLLVLQSPVHAALYRYDISGRFSQTAGPNAGGRFSGTARWNTNLGPQKQGAWYAWSFQFFDARDQLLQEMSSTSKEDGPGPGCFASPLEAGEKAAGAFISSAPGGIVCDGTGQGLDGAEPASPLQTYLAISSSAAYSWSLDDQLFEAEATFFRLLLAPDRDDPLQLVAATPERQGRAGLGWAALSSVPSESCDGDGEFPSSKGGACPFAGNGHNIQGLSDSEKEPVEVIASQEKDETGEGEGGGGSGGSGSGGSGGGGSGIPPPVSGSPAPLGTLGLLVALSASRQLRRRCGAAAAVAGQSPCHPQSRSQPVRSTGLSFRSLASGSLNRSIVSSRSSTSAIGCGRPSR